MKLFLPIVFFLLVSVAKGQTAPTDRTNNDSLTATLNSLQDSRDKLQQSISVLEKSQEQKATIIAGVEKKLFWADSMLTLRKADVRSLEENTRKTAVLKKQIKALKKDIQKDEAMLIAGKKELEDIKGSDGVTEKDLAMARQMIQELNKKIAEIQSSQR